MIVSWAQDVFSLKYFYKNISCSLKISGHLPLLQSILLAIEMLSQLAAGGIWSRRKPPQILCKPPRSLQQQIDDPACSSSEAGSWNLACKCWNFPVCSYKLNSVFLCYCRGGANRSVQASKSPGKQLETDLDCSAQLPRPGSQLLRKAKWLHIWWGSRFGCSGFCLGSPWSMGGKWALRCSDLLLFPYLLCFQCTGYPPPIAVCLWKGRWLQLLEILGGNGIFTCSWRKRVSSQNSELLVWSEMPATSGVSRWRVLVLVWLRLKSNPTSVTGAASALRGLSSFWAEMRHP